MRKVNGGHDTALAAYEQLRQSSDDQDVQTHKSHHLNIKYAVTDVTPKQILTG